MDGSNSTTGSESLQVQIDDKVIIVQILVGIFLCINLLLIVTFFSKDCFYTAMRYMLFAVTLLSDSMILIISNMLLILSYWNYSIHIGLCVTICITVAMYTFVTPVTLTAMALERYVAICMPLRHAELCSTQTALHLIFIIHSLSSVPGIVVLSAYFASASNSVYMQYRICTVDIFIPLQWQNHVKLVVHQLYFLIMSSAIIFSYSKIVKVATAASGEDKKSTWKGVRTVILHAFQLFLSLIQLWCPFVEAAVLQIDLALYKQVRYFNYIAFILAPRCLSPLIYGLRDEMFFLTLKHNLPFGFNCFKKKCADRFCLRN